VPTILVVDDAPDIRFLLRAVLQRADHTILEATSGTAALDLLADGLRPDAVILDIQMPGLDGWDTLTQLRAHPLEIDAPVLMLSVKASTPDLQRAWRLGCDAYLAKPFDITSLAHQVEELISASPEERAALRHARLAAHRVPLQETS